MVDTLGLHIVFFTHSAADLQWPELARLICPDDPDSSSVRKKAVQEIADWFFYQRIVKFIDVLYTGVLGASDYWFRFEWQHRDSPHVHGLACLPDAPDMNQVLATSEEYSAAAKKALIQYVDKIINTTNPAVLPDGSNIDEAPPPKTNPHICNLPYSEVEDFDRDLAVLIATCQRHPLLICLLSAHPQWPTKVQIWLSQASAALVMEDEDPLLLIASNDGIINSLNPVQLSA